MKVGFKGVNISWTCFPDACINQTPSKNLSSSKTFLDCHRHVLEMIDVNFKELLVPILNNKISFS